MRGEDELRQAVRQPGKDVSQHRQQQGIEQHPKGEDLPCFLPVPLVKIQKKDEHDHIIGVQECPAG